MNCLYCGNELEAGVVAFCRVDFFNIPHKDRVQFRRQYIATKGNFALMQPKIERIKRLLKEKYDSTADVADVTKAHG
jgi:hypothetical protein